MSANRLTARVRIGLRLVDMEMSATADTMEDRPDEQQAIREALAWINAQIYRVEQRRAKAAGAAP